MYTSLQMVIMDLRVRSLAQRCFHVQHAGMRSFVGDEDPIEQVHQVIHNAARSISQHLQVLCTQAVVGSIGEGLHNFVSATLQTVARLSGNVSEVQGPATLWPTDLYQL